MGNSVVGGITEIRCRGIGKDLGGVIMSLLFDASTLDYGLSSVTLFILHLYLFYFSNHIVFQLAIHLSILLTSWGPIPFQQRLLSSLLGPRHVPGIY